MMPRNTQARCAALRAAREEHGEAQLGEVLELAFGRRVVDRDHGIVDEAEEGVAVVPPPAAQTAAA
jgi:hypothetical protein